MIKIDQISPLGEIISAVDMKSGRRVDVHAVIGNLCTAPIERLMVATFEARPVNGLIRVKLCEVSGFGHFIDIAGEGVAMTDRFNPIAICPPQNLHAFIQHHTNNEILRMIGSHIMVTSPSPISWYIPTHVADVLATVPD
jgi:hypothetical protein